MKKAVLNILLFALGTLISGLAVAQAPEVSSLVLSASSGSNRTIDDLSCVYNSSPSVVTTAVTWYRNGVSENTLYLPFEGGAGNNLLDFSGNNHNAYFSADATEEPTWEVNGGHDSNGAFSFDGNDFMIVDDVIQENSSYTKTAWVNIAGSDFRNIMSSVRNDDNDHHFKVDPDNTLNAGHSFGLPVVSDPDPLVAGQWYFVAVSFYYPTGEMILYKDGVEVDRNFVEESLRNVLDPTVLVGAKAYLFEWEGLIDEPRVFNRALSPEQILAMYNTGNEFVAAQETRGYDQWQVRVTPFSETEVGSTVVSNNLNIQAAAISNLSLQASSPGVLSVDDLTVTYSINTNVLETATAWYRNNTPFGLMYLPFEGGTQNAFRDFSGSDNDATPASDISHLPTWDQTGGVDGSGGFIFDGDDYLLAGDIFPLGSSYTKSAWVNIAGSNYRNIMSSVLHDRNNHVFKVDADGTLNAGHNAGEYIVRDPAPLTPGEWYFVAVTFDYTTGEMILYKNGNEVDTETVPSDLRDVADPSLLIGALNYLFRWEGAMDEPRLYDRALSPEQILSLYNDRGNVIAGEETSGPDEWYARVTPFSLQEVGITSTSNVLEISSLVVSDIPDQDIQEGSSFSPIDLDDYVTVYEFTEADLDWTSSGSSELTVTINPTSHVATVTVPDVDWYGSENITFTATNPNSDTDFTELSFTVEPVNDAPVLVEIGGQMTDEDVPLTGRTVTFTDADPDDSHTISVSSSNPNVVVTNLSGNTSGSTYDLEPATNWNGSTQITVTVTDNGTGTLSDSEEYTLLVNPVNDAPELTPIGVQETNEDENLTGLSVVFTDVDASDQHTITIVSDDSHVSVENLTGHINGSMYDLVPAADWNGIAQITVRVTDNGTGALSDSETYTLTVHPVNDAPVVSDINAQSTDEDTELTDLVVSFSDVDASDGHVISIVSSEAGVSIANLSGNTSGSTYDLVPAPDWNGVAQITVTVTDDGTGNLADSKVYAFTVNPVDDAPRYQAIGDQVVDEDGALRNIPVVFTDPETSDTHTVEVISSTGNVIVANLSGNTSGSSYALIPVENWNGSAEITVTVTENGSVLFDSETYTLTVNAVNDAPDTVRLSNDMVEERVALGTSIGLFSSYDVDEGDTHQYQFVLDGGIFDVDNDAFTIDGDTLKTNTELDYEIKSSYSILIQSVDSQGATATQNFTISVGDLDETSVKDIYNSPLFNVYPVPAIDFVTVEVDNPRQEELVLEIYSNAGKLVHAEPMFSRKRIDLTGFSDGMYIVKIRGEQVYGTRKIIIKDR